jgi:hypothetical protein
VNGAKVIVSDIGNNKSGEKINALGGEESLMAVDINKPNDGPICCNKQIKYTAP